ncbi:hypothetical protein I3843_13G146000 [Carya illinoinensis]|nr:hypothetical protein I3843_13G146000 [Carya illinoinensis]
MARSGIQFYRIAKFRSMQFSRGGLLQSKGRPSLHLLAFCRQHTRWGPASSSVPLSLSSVVGTALPAVANDTAGQNTRWKVTHRFAASPKAVDAGGYRGDLADRSVWVFFIRGYVDL